MAGACYGMARKYLTPQSVTRYLLSRATQSDCLRLAKHAFINKLFGGSNTLRKRPWIEEVFQLLHIDILCVRSSEVMVILSLCQTTSFRLLKYTSRVMMLKEIEEVKIFKKVGEENASKR